MKKLLSLFAVRQLLAVSAIGLCFAGNFQLAQRPLFSSKFGWQLPLEAAEAEDEENDGDHIFADRPDQALLQDAALTRDPATGTVPTERLLAAARYNETRLKGLAQRGTATTGLADASWSERGPNNVGGRILSLLVEPNDATGNTVWAGTADGGLWKATNATTSVQWTNVNSYLSNLAVSTVTADPGTNVRYCGTGEGFFNIDAVRGAGIWKSTDGGATWAQLASTNNSNFFYTQKLVVHPVSHDVYAATRTGLWRSQNGGTTWAQVLSTTTSPASATNSVADVEISADNTVFAAFGLIFSTDAIYRSPSGDAGSWINLNAQTGSGLPTTGFERIEIACAPSDPNRVYAVFQATSGRSLLNIYRSMDKGATWVALSRPGATATAPNFDYTNGQAWYNLALAVSPIDPNAVYVGGLDLWFTKDAGNATPANIVWDHESDWTAATTSVYYVHADHHAIAFVPTTTAPANQAFFGSDGGLAYSADASISTPTEPQFSQRNTGLNVTQFYGVAMHPTSPDYFLAGAQDNGTQKFTTTGINATTEVTGGDGGLSAIDQVAPVNQFTSYVYNTYYRSKDGGSAFPDYFKISDTQGSFINAWDFDSNAKVVYAGYSANTYMAWTNPLTATSNANGLSTDAVINYPALPAGSGKVTFVGISPLTANRIYLGTNNGRLLRVDNAQTTTPSITALYTGPANTSVSCVAVDPANEQHLLVTLSNYGVVSVLETTDANAATPTWTSVEGALPDMPVRWALFDPRGASRALLATEMGVYATDKLNGSSTVWNPASNGPINTRVDMLRYRPSDKLVAAATHGRGLFTSALFALPLPVTLTSLVAARETGGAAVVRWKTASEQNSLRFEVERSANAVDYQRVGSVAAAGNSSSFLAYAFTDGTAGSGAYYYRLRQVDVDGKVAYSPAVALAAAPASSGALLSSVYPNPFRAELNLELAQPPTGSGAVALALVDAQGRRVWAASFQTTSRQLPLDVPAGLARGTYVLTVRANGQQASRRVVKE